MADSLPDKMEKVCDDADSSWHYHDGKYYRVYGRNNSFTYIFGKYLPNPEEIESSRIREAERLGNKVDIAKARCTPATYKLWGHWKTVCKD